jgi:dienelactone hydrolase
MKGNVDMVSSTGRRAVLLATILLGSGIGAAQSRQSPQSADPVPVPMAEPARIEMWPLASATMRDDAFLTGAATSTPVTLAGELRLPSGGSERVPAVVMLHGSSGISPAGERWTRELNGLGIATFLIDSFTGRGLSSTVEDQSRLGQMAMVYDAYRALELLAKHPRIDPARIGLFGNSRGGVGALYASVSRFQRLHAPKDVAFAVYVSLYPPCTREYIDDAKVADRPIRIFHGTADLIAPIERCRAYVRRMRAAGADVQLVEYDGAHHGFDGHQLPALSGPQPGASAFTCDVYEEPAGRFLNRETGRPFSPSDACAKGSRITGYDARAHANALQMVKQTLRQVFRLAR